MAEHPLPWRLGQQSRIVEDAAGDPVAVLPDEATAILIVDAVNGRDMVATCHAALAELQETRWSNAAFDRDTIEGRTFVHVSKAMDLLKGKPRA